MGVVQAGTAGQAIWSLWVGALAITFLAVAQFRALSLCTTGDIFDCTEVERTIAVESTLAGWPDVLALFGHETATPRLAPNARNWTSEVCRSCANIRGSCYQALHIAIAAREKIAALQVASLRLVCEAVK